MANTARVEIGTTAYEFSHGRRPRGEGYWAFFPDRACARPEAAFWFSGTFAEARRAAVAYAREHGLSALHVGP